MIPGDGEQLGDAAAAVGAAADMDDIVDRIGDRAFDGGDGPLSTGHENERRESGGVLAGQCLHGSWPVIRYARYSVR